MKTIITYKDNYSKPIKTITRKFNLNSFEENTSKFYFDAEQITKKEVFFEGAKIVIANFNVKNPFSIDVEHDFPFIKVQFELEGYSEYLPNCKGSLPVLIDNGQYNFFYFPKVNGKLKYKKPRKIVQIQFTETFIKNAFRDFFKISDDFGKALRKKKPFILFPKSKPISYKMHLILNDIINCSFDKEIKEVYLSSKIKEILSLLVVDIKQIPSNELTRADLQKIEQAEQILMQNLQNPPTILNLSKEIGINQQKLKTLFKKHFKSSIYKYVSSQRMLLAKKLLANQDLTISEIALKIGYKNPQHFTVAFKKKFAILPKDFRQN